MTVRFFGIANFCKGMLLFLLAMLVAGRDKPISSISYFNGIGARLHMGSAVVHDSIEQNVYVSLDNGRNWKPAEGIPAGTALRFIEHPVDNRFGFVLTIGTTHYRTEDQGRTWQPFRVPVKFATGMYKPLSFHPDPKKSGYILYHGTECDKHDWDGVHHGEIYYTKEAFSDEPKLLRKETTKCQFAHSSKNFEHTDLIYCVGFDTSSISDKRNLSSSRLFYSTDFFEHEKLEVFGVGNGVVSFDVISKFIVVAVSQEPHGNICLYVTTDTKTWAQAHFPHTPSALLSKYEYKIHKPSMHSLAIDVTSQDRYITGTLFVSDSSGAYFIESLKDMNRGEYGDEDYENIYGVEGIRMTNVILNTQDVRRRGQRKKLKTLITFDDGSTWAPITAPNKDVDGKTVACNPSDVDACSLHLHFLTTSENFERVISSPAPGFVVGVGNIGESLDSYDKRDTFLSTDAGVTWRMVSRGPHKYVFGDSGSILVMVEDDKKDTDHLQHFSGSGDDLRDLYKLAGTDYVKYSSDLGKTWTKFELGVKLRILGFTALPDSASQKFLLLGQVHDQEDTAYVAVVHLDFSKTRGRKCSDDDFEKWYVHQQKSICLMGHKQWHKRRKPEANCYVGEKYKDLVVHEENCKCTAVDFECGFNFVRRGDKCESVGPEVLPPGLYTVTSLDDTYEASSGWRKIPGNTCEGGEEGEKDKKNKEAVFRIT